MGAAREIRVGILSKRSLSPAITCAHETRSVIAGKTALSRGGGWQSSGLGAVHNRQAGGSSGMRHRAPSFSTSCNGAAAGTAPRAAVHQWQSCFWRSCAAVLASPHTICEPRRTLHFPPSKDVDGLHPLSAGNPILHDYLGHTNAVYVNYSTMKVDALVLLHILVVITLLCVLPWQRTPLFFPPYLPTSHQIRKRQRRHHYVHLRAGERTFMR